MISDTIEMNIFSLISNRNVQHLYCVRIKIDETYDCNCDNKIGIEKQGKEIMYIQTNDMQKHYYVHVQLFIMKIIITIIIIVRYICLSIINNIDIFQYQLHMNISVFINYCEYILTYKKPDKSIYIYFGSRTLLRRMKYIVYNKI